MQNTDFSLQYTDAPPAGYTLASNRQTIDANDMVFFQATATQDAQWGRPTLGANIIGACVHELWPVVMGLAVKR